MSDNLGLNQQLGGQADDSPEAYTTRAEGMPYYKAMPARENQIPTSSPTMSEVITNWNLLLATINLITMRLDKIEADMKQSEREKWESWAAPKVKIGLPPCLNK